jgi:hypothetical protein
VPSGARDKRLVAIDCRTLAPTVPHRLRDFQAKAFAESKQLERSLIDGAQAFLSDDADIDGVLLWLGQEDSPVQKVNPDWRAYSMMAPRVAVIGREVRITHDEGTLGQTLTTLFGD